MGPQFKAFNVWGCTEAQCGGWLNKVGTNAQLTSSISREVTNLDIGPAVVWEK